MPRQVGTFGLPVFAAPPVASYIGQEYFDSTADRAYYWNGTSWVDMTGGGSSAPPSFVTQDKWRTE